MTERPAFPPALCNRCKFLGEADGTYRKAYVLCKYPVMLTAAMRLHSLSIMQSDRLIPRHALVGFSDSSRFKDCPAFENRVPSALAAQSAESVQGPAPVIEVPASIYEGLNTLLAPFKPEKADV